jgi:hypothetical protein
VVDAFEEAVDLGAQRATGDGMLRVADEARRYSVDDRDLPGARVRTVVVAGAEHGQLGHPRALVMRTAAA